MCASAAVTQRALALPAHIGGEQGAGADRLREDQRVAGLEPALAEDGGAIDQSVDGKAERKFRAFAGMPAHERASGLAQELRWRRPSWPRGPPRPWPPAHRDRGDGERRLGLGRPWRRCRRARGWRRSCRTGRGRPRWRGNNRPCARTASARRCRRRAASSGASRPTTTSSRVAGAIVAERPRQHRGADLGAASAAAHGDGRDLLDGGLIRERRGRAARGPWHVGQLVEPAHEAAVDPVLQRQTQSPSTTRPLRVPTRVPLAGRDQVERVALRPEGPQRLAGQRAPDVVGQHRPGAHGIDAGLRQSRGPKAATSPAANTSAWPTARKQASTRTKPPASSASPVSREPAARRRPAWSRGSRRRRRRAVARAQDGRPRPASPRAPVDDRDAALGEDPLEAPPKCCRKFWQDLVRAGHEHEGETAGIIARSRQPRGVSDAASESRSSTPPAPAPTSAIRARPFCPRTRAISASKRGRKPSIGFTGMACSAAPGIRPVFGVEPMSSESEVVRDRRPVAADHPFARRDRARWLRPGRAARRQSGRAGRCRYARRRSRKGPATRPGSMPE